MSVLAALNQLRELAIEFPADERPTFAPPASSEAADLRARTLGVLAGSLTAFLWRVAEDWKHASAGDAGWTYVPGR